MSGDRKNPIYSQDSAVWIETGGEEPLALLQRAIENAGFLAHLESALLASGKRREDFLIAIKPNFMAASRRMEPEVSYTSPALVEHLVGRLREHGFSQIAVVEARNVYDLFYAGRGVQEVAAMLGYTGQGYRIADLSEEKEPYDYGSVLGQHVAGRTWRAADFRVSFAKNRTHWQCFYAGCLENVFGCLPEADKLFHYQGKKREFYECCVLAADRFPVHFGFLDAWHSGDGFSGPVREAVHRRTRAILASPNIVALDWVMGEKMGLDPALNPVLQEAMYRWGNIRITRHGNMTTWQPWNNIRPSTVIALDALEEAYGAFKFFLRAFASRPDPRFPPVSKA